MRFDSHYFTEDIKSEDGVAKYTIPKKLQKNYEIDGDISNIKNWKGKIILANNAGEGQKKGQLDKVGYVAVNLKNNEIIPITRADEHRTGWDLMYHFQEKGLIDDAKDWMIVFAIGNTYLYKNEEDDDKIQALKKLTEYGIDQKTIPIILVGGWSDVVGTKDKNRIFTLDAILKNGLPTKKVSKQQTGDYVQPTMLGGNLIDALKGFTDSYSKYIGTESGIIKKSFENRMRAHTVALHKLLIGQKDLIKASDIGQNLMDISDYMDMDIQDIADNVIGTGGIKNKIHHRIIKPNTELGTKLFGNNEKMDSEFKRMDIK